MTSQRKGCSTPQGAPTDGRGDGQETLGKAEVDLEVLWWRDIGDHKLRFVVCPGPPCDRGARRTCWCCSWWRHQVDPGMVTAVLGPRRTRQRQTPDGCSEEPNATASQLTQYGIAGLDASMPRSWK